MHGIFMRIRNRNTDHKSQRESDKSIRKNELVVIDF